MSSMQSRIGSRNCGWRFVTTCARATSFCLLLISAGCEAPRASQPASALAPPAAVRWVDGGELSRRSIHCPPRAIVETEHVQRAIEFERALSLRYEQLPGENKPWFAVSPGRSSVLVVAGHAAATTREGKLKPTDSGTGSLADALHRMADVTVIASTAMSPSDSNYYDDNEFKRELARLLDTGQYTLVLDLHASNAYRPYDVDLGTMGGESLRGRPEIAAELIDRFAAEGLTAFSVNYFAASRAATVTKFVAARGVPAVQLEINDTCLILAKDGRVIEGRELQMHRFAQVLQGLIRFIRAWDERPVATSMPDSAM
jgi:hypothetical protein